MTISGQHAGDAVGADRRQHSCFVAERAGDQARPPGIVIRAPLRVRVDVGVPSAVVDGPHRLRAIHHTWSHGELRGRYQQYGSASVRTAAVRATASG